MSDLKRITINGVAYDVTPRSHSEDTNNPHGSTAAQVGARPNTWTPTASEVGAAPSGYGLGEQVYHTHRLSSMTDLDNLDRTCYFALSLSSATTIHGVEFGVAHGRHLAYADGIHYQELIMIGVLYKFERYCYNGKWSEWYKTDPEAFAPAGYGLGYECVNIDSIQNINKNGWWVTNGDTPDGDYWECISLVVNGGTCVVVHAWNYDRNLQAVRTKRNGAWGEWEWVNPPLNKGVEYRTTKRWKGVPVYCRLLNLGWLAAGSHSFPLEDIPITGTSMGIDIRIYNNNQEFVSENGNVTSKWLGRGSEYLTLSFTLAVAHGGIDAYIEYAK